MRALDLFCGAGGASMGLHRLGFEVVGVERKQSARDEYPFAVMLEDVRDVCPETVRKFDFVWASPPCQAFTAYKRRPGHVAEAQNLIPFTRALLSAAGVPYVIENVPGAPLENPVQLCGSSFGLDVRRHRIFECSFPVLTPPCSHGWQTPRFPQATNRENLRSTVEVGVWRIPLDIQQRAMGIDWMSLENLSQAIPPAYSEFLGRAALMAGAVECAA